MTIIDRQRAHVARTLELRRVRLLAKRDFAQAGERLVTELVELNADTEFGRLHDFSRIRSIADFQRAVPMRGYDEVAGWIERMTRGEPRILTAEPPVLFRKTSGTTGPSKYVPVTARSLVTDQEKVALGLLLHCIRFPEVVEIEDAVMFATYRSSPVKGQVTEAGIPWISYSEHNQYHPSAIFDGAPCLSGSFYAADRPLDYLDAIYVRLRNSAETDLRGMYALNPSSLIALAAQLAESWERITEEVRAGTVLGDVRRAPNPRRADELRALGADGRKRPRDLWPNFKFVQCWKSASCALYLPQVRELFGDVEILPFPFIASEGIAAVHLDDHPTAGLLVPDGVLCEFLPVDGNGEANVADPQLLSDLEVGQTYELVHSGFNGLYRYRMGDRFIVNSRDSDGVPRLEFVGRAGVVSSFTSEKLTEQHVIHAVAATASALGITVHQYTCFPRWSTPPYYAFAVEATSVIDPEVMARELDRQLGAVNSEYPSKRATGRLGPVELELVSPGSFVRLRQRLIARGANANQLKDVVLQRDDKLLDLLRTCSVETRA